MMKKYNIEEARKDQAEDIAALIMIAMDYDCCQNFAGEEHSLDDFYRMMTELVEMEDSQYSYRNTLVALNMEGEVIGILAGYDGKDLHRLREKFILAAKQHLGRDFSGMDDETSAGEYYIDSLAVKEEYRKQGVASALLRAVIDRQAENQPVGLLVDLTHPWAERLYTEIGFKFQNYASWGGHDMKHLQFSEE